MIQKGMLEPKPMSLVRSYISPLAWEVCVEPLTRGETPVIVSKALRCLLSQPSIMKMVAPNKIVLPLLSAVKPEKGMVTMVVQILSGTLELKYKPVPLIKKLLLQMKEISRRLSVLLEAYTELRSSAEPLLEGPLKAGYLPVLSNPEVRVIARTVAIAADGRLRRLQKDIQWVQERFEYHDDVFRGYALMRKTAKKMKIPITYKGPSYRDMIYDIQKDMYKSLDIYFSYPTGTPEKVKDVLIQKANTSRAREIDSTRYYKFLRQLSGGLRTLDNMRVDGLPYKVKAIPST